MRERSRQTMSLAVDHTRALAFYAEQSQITDPGPHRRLFDALPRDVAGVVRVVQGLLLHPAGAELYGEPPEEGPAWGYRTVAETLEKLLALDDSPLTTARPPGRRLRGNCRNFAVLGVSMLRHQGIPSRRRVGFATYLPGRHSYIHEVAEYWDAARNRWVLVDPQNDDVVLAAQRRFFASIGQPERARYDTLDLAPDEQFVLGGTAWRRCRAGLADPDGFRGGGRKGWREVGMALLQDLDGLNKAELLSNESGFHPGEPGGPVTDGETALLDRVADVTADPDGRFDEVRELYATTSYGRWVGEKLAALGLA
jgi:hypothetical protein